MGKSWCTTLMRLVGKTTVKKGRLFDKHNHKSIFLFHNLLCCVCLFVITPIKRAMIEVDTKSCIGMSICPKRPSKAAAARTTLIGNIFELRTSVSTHSAPSIPLSILHETGTRMPTKQQSDQPVQSQIYTSKLRSNLWNRRRDRDLRRRASPKIIRIVALWLSF